MVQRYLGAATIVLLMAMVLTRSQLMRRKGIRAFYFGNIDKKDFLIPPFALFYVYAVFAAAFDWPSVSRSEIWHSGFVSWLGVALCFSSLGVFLWSLVSFGRSFRVGIDTEHPGNLVTDGVFAFSRNPIYVAFGGVLSGQFLILPNWILLAYLIAGVALFHRQVLREEAFLAPHYGSEYQEYCRRVRRYL